MHLKIRVLLFLIWSYSTSWGTVTISGKIQGYDGKSTVFYRPTVEGIFVPYWKEVKPSPNGAFKIEFENEGYGNTRITYKQTYYRFFHDTNSKIYFEIKEVQRAKKKRITGEQIFLFTDSLKQAMTVRISGDYEAINKFYNRNLRSSYFTTQMVDGNFYSGTIYNAKSPSSALALLDSLEQIELNQISQLPAPLSLEDPAAEIKAKEIKDFLTNEVHAFYGAIFLNGMFLKRKDQVDKARFDANVNIYNRDWELLIEKLYHQAKSDLKPTPNSPDYVDFMESMAYAMDNYQKYDFPQDTAMSLDEIVTNRLFKYDTTLFQNRKVRFAYELVGIHQFLNDQLFYSPNLLYALYDLQSKYPTSVNFDFYKNKIEKLRKNLETSNQDFKNAKIIHTNYDSFEELLKRFEGKNILVDIWATWCHPCIEEFKHKASIQSFIEADKIEVLFISIDKPQWEDRWRQSIKINELQGNHFRADKEFISDMWNVIGGFKGGIPRYVLIDKAGKIFKSTAASPSEGSELIHQIELMIN